MERRSVLDREALGGLRAAAWVLVGLYGLFGVMHIFFLEPAARRFMVPLTLGEAAFILLLQAWWRARPPRPEASHAWLLALGGLALLNSGTLLLLLGEPKQTTNLFFLVIAGGYLMLRRPHFAAYAAAVVGAFLAAAATGPPSDDWLHYVFGMVSAVALAVVLHVVRVASTLRLDRARQEAQASERSLRAILTSAPLALFALDRDGRFTFVEGKAMEDIGVRPEDLLGRFVREVYRGHPGLPAAERALAGEATRVTTEEKGRLFDVEYTPLPGGGAVGVATDVTDRRRAEQATREAQLRADEAHRLHELDRLRTSFVNVVAHELNTPLTPIQMQLSLVDTADESRRARATQILRRNIDRLTRIIKDLVTINRLQQGRLELRPTATDLAEVVRHSVDSFRDAAGAAGIDLRADGGAPAPTRGDAEKLQQVLDNLLTNAIKFTPRGGRIEVRLVPDGDGWRIEVADTGPGIAAGDLPRLFQPFSQLEAGRERGGTGLGLHLSRAIVEAHGGRIWAASPGEGRGSVFALWLRRAPEATPAASPAAE